jgi:hypothetical protein
VRLTRRDVVVGGAAAALGAAGVYELVDRFTGPAARRPLTTQRPEQHILEGLREVRDNGVEVVVPPLHHQVMTARLTVGDDRRALLDAKRDLDERLHALDDNEGPPQGVALSVAWGLPYFRQHIPPPLVAQHLPLDLRASKKHGRPVRALIDTIRFPSDPADTILEQNHLAFVLSSDDRHAVSAAAKKLVGNAPYLELTSIRRGFVGGGFGGHRSLPKQMALATGVRGAELIPDTAELFLGFTSTQKSALGPPRIANFETLGLTNVGPDGYFRHGTHMHLSHVFEDLEAWYLLFDYNGRAETMFRPGLAVPEDTQTVRQGPRDAQTSRDVVREFRETGHMGHSGAVQPASRLQHDVRGADGELYPKGTAVPQRVDFNTLDNPFFWTSRPERDRYSPTPAAGLHFVVFNPTSDDFHRVRLALDGRMPDGSVIPLDRTSQGQGFNSVLSPTHRQNFLVPPRRHRSFPLAELIK